MNLLSRKTSLASQLVDSSSLDFPHVTIGTTVISVEVVSTVEAIKKGLSHRRSLEASQGMLFLFDHNAQFKFWMRGMRFPIDIIWIGEDYKVVDITENLQPAGLFKRPPFYSPSVPARYVLEVNANFCLMHNIRPHDSVVFTSLPL